jgi:hypothetical protein
VRVESDARLSYEVIKDLPQAEGAARMDYGTTIGLSWSYGR